MVTVKSAERPAKGSDKKVVYLKELVSLSLDTPATISWNGAFQSPL